MAARISGGVCNTYIHIDLILEETATSLENNTSTVNWKLVGYMGSGGTSSYWYSNSYHTINVKINGATVYSLGNTTQKAISIGTNHSQASPTVIVSGTVTVPHDNDGSKVCSASFSVAYRYNSAFTWSGAGNIALTNIARASVLTTGAGSSFYFGQNIVFNTNRASTAFTHKLYYSVAGRDSVLIATGITDSYTWTVPLSLMNYFPDTTSGTINFRLETYSGSTLTGSNTLSIKELVPSDIVPAITFISCIDPEGYLSTYGAFVQGRSQLLVNVSAVSAYGSAVSYYDVTVDGTKALYGNATNLLTSGTKTVTVTVTDTRGRKASSSTTITVLEYVAPTINKLKVYRCNSAGAADEQGAYMKVDISATITALSNKNGKYYTLHYKKQGDAGYTLHSSYSGAYSWNTSLIIAASTDTGYDILLSAMDNFANSVKAVQIGTAFTLMDFRSTGKGVAFGKVSESDDFDVNMPANFRDVVAAKRIAVGWDSGYEGSINCCNHFRSYGNTGWYNQTYGGGWYMSDTTWIRANGDKSVYTGGAVYAGKIHTTGGANLDTVAATVSNIQNKIATTVLYNNPSGLGRTNITLGSNLSKYAFIKIFYKSNDGNYGCVDHDTSNSGSVRLSIIDCYNDHTFLKSARYYLESNVLKFLDGYTHTVKGDSITAENSILITKIIGYNL